MDKYIINGGKKLSGRAAISGSKNASLPLMVASLMTDETITLRNVPDLMDVMVLIKILENMGKKISFENNVLVIEQDFKPELPEAPYNLVKKMRASVIVLGPILAKYGKCRVSLPGGCAFGPRPIDLHIKGLEKLGAEINLDHGYIDAHAEKLKGCKMVLAGKFGSSVLATDNVLMAAVFAEGKTVIESAAREPECVDLMKMLVKMGAKIEGIGTSTVTVEGVDKLHGVDYSVIPDRIEAGTFLCAGLATRGDITITNCEPDHLVTVIESLVDMGASVKVGQTEIRAFAEKELEAFAIDTLPYPMFPTDLQAPFAALAATVKGRSSLTERIYPDRFKHIPELKRLGVEAEIEGSTAIINGGKALRGAEVQASDLRAGAGLVVAALVSDNTTQIHRIYHIDRGYENLDKKLLALGADVRREQDDII